LVDLALAREARAGFLLASSLLLQYHGQWLIIGLNRDGQRLALIESRLRDFEADNDGPFLLGSSRQLGFR
jgi:hypothetical protein